MNEIDKSIGPGGNGSNSSGESSGEAASSDGHSQSDAAPLRSAEQYDSWGVATQQEATQIENAAIQGNGDIHNYHNS